MFTEGDTYPLEPIKDLLKFLGEDPEREGLQETPQRFIKALGEMTEGYRIDPKKLLKEFESEGYSQMILLKKIPFTSLCEHHMLKFTGTAHVAYIPNKKIVGLSKLARVVDAYARRFQVQERLTKQIAELLWKELKPEGVGVVIEAEHSCMADRGIMKRGGIMVTSDLRGSFLKDQEVRSEFYAAIR